MSSPLQTPFGANLTGSLLQGTGFRLNPVTSSLVGTSNSVSSYTPGTVVSQTCLDRLTSAINAGYGTLGVYLDTATYANLIAIGSSTIPALGNSKPPTYTWIGPANAGDTTSTAAQAISWYPYTATATTNTYPSSNPTPKQWSDLTQTTYNPNITQWGWVRLFALQACYEFNWNNSPTASSVVYKDFITSFQITAGFLDNNNSAINTLNNSLTFLKDTYSNNDDLITGDITGVNLSTSAFGKDLIALGKAIDLSTIDTFGLPSNLLATLKKYNAITGSLSYAMMASGISVSDLNGIIEGTLVPTKLQEQQLYGAYSIITNVDLANILVPLNCSTPGLTSLIDLLNPQKLFPNSYLSMTVPIYNSGPGPTNAKTYYRIYNTNGVNTDQLSSPAVIAAIGDIGLAPVSTTAPGIGTNFQIKPVGFGAYSRGAIPDDISIAAGAFSIAMRQINHIQTIPIEKFAQVVYNMETTAGLPLVAGTNIPANTDLLKTGLTQFSYGSGPNGTYTMSDFFGCMSGLPYQWTDIKAAIQSLQTSTLSNIYQNIYTTITTASTDVSATVQSYIDSANAEISSIMNRNPDLASKLNRMWNATGTQLTNEQTARDIALSPVTTPRTNYIGSFPGSIISFVNSMQEYSKKTEPNMHCQTIEAISDITTVGGQSQIALMRQLRNQDKLSVAGIASDAIIPNAQTELTNKILLANGTVSTAKSGQGIPAGNATFTIPADHNVLPLPVKPIGYFNNNVVDTVSSAPVSSTVLDNTGGPSTYFTYVIPQEMNPAPVLGSIPDTAEVGQDLAGPNIVQVSNPITPIAGGSLPKGPITPINLGGPIVPGSLGGSPYKNAIAPELSIPYISGTLSSPTLTVPEAIDQVVQCNCDCWLE